MCGKRRKEREDLEKNVVSGGVKGFLNYLGEEIEV